MFNANFPESMNLQAARYCFRINRITGLNGRLVPDFNWVPNRTYPPLFYFKFYSTPPKTREQNPVYKNHIRKGFDLKREPYYINYKGNVAYPPKYVENRWAKHLTGKAL